MATREEEVEEAEREAGADGAGVEGRGEVGERMVGREDVMVVVTMDEEVRGLGVGGKVMGVRVVKQEVMEVVEEGGEGCLGTGGGMRVEEESGGVGRVEEVGEEVDVGGGEDGERGGGGPGGFG